MSFRLNAEFRSDAEFRTNAEFRSDAQFRANAQFVTNCESVWFKFLVSLGPCPYKCGGRADHACPIHHRKLALLNFCFGESRLRLGRRSDTRVIDKLDQCRRSLNSVPPLFLTHTVHDNREQRLS